MVLREFPQRFGHTGGVVTLVGSHLLILGYNTKGEPLLLRSGNDCWPKCGDGARTHSRRPWAQRLSQQLGRRPGNKAITNEMALIVKTPLWHTHFLGPLVSFVPFSDNVWPLWVPIRYWWRLSGVEILWHIWFTLFGCSMLCTWCCVFRWRLCLLIPPLSGSVWGATGNGPHSAGENGSTQELMMHLYSPHPWGYAWYCIRHTALTAMLYL